jgi:hypothetical protein
MVRALRESRVKKVGRKRETQPDLSQYPDKETLKSWVPNHVLAPILGIVGTTNVLVGGALQGAWHLKRQGP